MTNKYTPMINQYLQIKEQHQNEILFFRLGDFYEMFFEDAQTASRELEITLTGRDGGAKNKIPMCGVPYHAAENYIARLIAKGYKVAICEQVEDVAQSKGIVKREVIKIITPGTVLGEGILTDNSNNYLVLLYQKDDAFCLSGTDISTGECFYSVYQGIQQALFDQLYRLMPAEVVIVEGFSYQDEVETFISTKLNNCSCSIVPAQNDLMKLLESHFAIEQMPSEECGKNGVGNLVYYLHKTLKNDLAHLNVLNYIDVSENLLIDSFTLRNLEITRNLRDGSKKDTLLAVLDFTKTAMGSRLLKKWLESPLVNIAKIIERQEAVEELVQDFSCREEIGSSLKEIYDFERLLTRIEVNTANARDLVALKTSLANLPGVKNNLLSSKSRLLQKINKNIELFTPVVELLEEAIVDNPGLSLKDGNIIKENYNKDLDELRAISSDSKSMLSEMEQSEKERTGIKSLKIGYNKVFGYYLEVTHSNTAAVPEHYIRKQTLANAERYITPELKDFENKILGAQEKIVNIEYQLFSEIRDKIKTVLVSIQKTAQEIAQIDVLMSLSEAANRNNYVRPNLTNTGEIIIKDGRHPLVEKLLQKELFVPNDTDLNHYDSEIMIITGPNMAGKSTYMRQVALLVLMAQVGSFIPAREAYINPVDSIFTRIGASDDLASGQSTFMVEMNEVAQILKNATKNSLIILDEIGRGTSTFDGMSIARAVIEYIKSKIGAKTLFATHYHELTDLDSYDTCIKNYSVAVRERGSEIVFLRRIVLGGADKSYGIHVAKLAGLPKKITDRANEILDILEKNQLGPEPARKTNLRNEDSSELSLFTNTISEQLLTLDVMSMSPLEALNELYRLQQQAKEDAGKI